MPRTPKTERRPKATLSLSTLTGGGKKSVTGVRFDVTLHLVTFTVIDKKWKPDNLAIELKRHSKAQLTDACPLIPTEEADNATVRWNQTLSVSFNLKNSDKGGLESKECKLSLEEVRAHGSRRSLATCSLDLTEHYDCDAQPTSITLPLKPASSKIGSATIELTIESSLLKDGLKQASDSLSIGSERTVVGDSLLDADQSSNRLSNQHLALDSNIDDDQSRTSIIVHPIVGQEQLDELNEKNRFLAAAKNELQDKLEETKRQLAFANEKHREQSLLLENKCVEMRHQLEAAVQEIKKVKAASEISEGVSTNQLLRLKAEKSRDKAEWEEENHNLQTRIESLVAEVAKAHETMQRFKEERSLTESKWEEERRHLEMELIQSQTDLSNRIISQRSKSNSTSGGNSKQMIQMGHFDLRLHPADVLPNQSGDADMADIVTELIGAKMERATLTLALEEAFLSNKELHRELTNQKLYCMEYSRKIAEMEARANKQQV